MTGEILILFFAAILLARGLAHILALVFPKTRRLWYEAWYGYGSRQWPDQVSDPALRRLVTIAEFAQAIGFLVFSVSAVILVVLQWRAVSLIITGIGFACWLVALAVRYYYRNKIARITRT